MRTPHRDRRRPGIIALCFVILALCVPASALTADYTVLPNGTRYAALVEVADADEYFLYDLGILGERIPIQTDDIEVFNENGSVAYESSLSGRITFPQGNYTIRYSGPILDNHLQASFVEPYDIRVHLSEGYDVRNPFLGVVSRGGEVTAENGTVTVSWEETRSMEIRFYDSMREQMLLMFGTLWIALCAIFVMPYLMMRLRDREEK
jgi:hypothetical protein